MKKGKLLTSIQRSKKSNEQTFIDDKRAVPISDGCIHGDHLESQYLESIHQDDFFLLCEKSNLDIAFMFSRMLTLRDKHRLNVFFRNIKERHGVRIMDSLIYLEEKYARFNQLIKCLDQENAYTLKLEASDISKKYKMTTNHLKDFLEFESK